VTVLLSNSVDGERKEQYVTLFEHEVGGAKSHDQIANHHDFLESKIGWRAVGRRSAFAYQANHVRHSHI